MKKIFAVAVLLASLGAAAFADGGFPPPTKPTEPPKVGIPLQADGGFPPPAGTVAKPGADIAA